MQFDIDCAIYIMNYIIDNQKLDLDSGKLTIFYCKHFYEDDKVNYPLSKANGISGFTILKV